jgi:putative DNA primase/helicase
MTTLDQAVAQMRGHGLPEFPGGLPRVNTAAIVRYGPKKRAWYRLHEFQGRNGKTFIAGAYGLWGAVEATKIESDWSGMDESERLRIERAQAEREAKERAKRERLANFAAYRAKRQYREALDIGPCPYLERKGVTLERRLKVLEDGTLLVPAWRFDETPPRVVGVQKIAADGTKRFNRGMAKAGSACLLGKPKEGEPILIAEGVATALSARMALDRKCAVYVAFDAGNLEAVTRTARALHPSSPLVICADDDWQTEGNPGRAYAERAMHAVDGAWVVFPVFAAEGREKGWTDFNDLHAQVGLASVAEQLGRVLAQVSGAATAPDAAQGAKPRREKRKAEPPGDPGKFARALRHWTLIRGTDTVFDAGVWSIVKISHLKLSEGEGFVKWWLEAEDRRTVWRDDLVFEPAGAAAHQLNLFRGMPVAPDRTKPCGAVLHLLQYLCGEADEDETPLTDWVLRWCALPLQRPGAKMRSSVVMHGADEGAGKNMFWGVVRAIYGHYGGIVTQSELESQFTGWASQKLMLIANEVVSRAELRHQTGRLKNFITEPEVWVNEKHLPARQESNHINFVFLSNETLPQILGHKDRRYCVIHTPPALSREFYAAVGAEIEAGAAEGLHAYLQALDLTGFDEFAPPPMTDAKRQLIELSKNSAQLFVDEWRDGLLDYPHCSARTRDIHQAYLRWCRRTAERFVMTETKFVGEVRHYLNLKQRRVRVPVGRAGDRAMATVFVIGEPPTDKPESRWIDDAVTQFADALRAGEQEGRA